MSLPANDSHLWHVCAAAEGGWLRRDISKASGPQPGCTHRLCKAAAGAVLLPAEGIRGCPEIWPFSSINMLAKKEGPAREAGARLTEAGQ